MNPPNRPNNPDEAHPSAPASASNTGEGWFPVATLLRPQGRRGELLAEPLTGFPEVFTPGQIFRHAPDKPGKATGSKNLYIADGHTLTLETSWRPAGRNAGRLVLKLAGIDSISAAEALTHHQLFLSASALPSLEPGAYLVRDLIGCTLFNGSDPIGAITALQFPIAADGHTRLSDAADLLVVHPENRTDPVLIPFVKAWLAAVDLDGKQITMHLPPGLLDNEEEA